MIIDKKTAGHYLWGDTCDSWVLVDTPTLSVKQEKMPVGTREKLHFHNKAQQFFFILSGNATFYLEGKKQLIGAEQGLLVSPGAQHFIANESDGILEFLVTSQPSTTNDRELVDKT